MVDKRVLRVLLVDDDEDDFIIARNFLRGAETITCDLTWANGFDAGLTQICTGGFDVCLSDYQMGARTGVELVREVVERGLDTPVILLTGRGSWGVDIEAMQAGAVDYLVKGEVGTAILERAVRYAVQRAESNRALRESEERYSLAVLGSKDGIWDWNLASNHVFFSTRWKQMFGLKESDVVDTVDAWFDRVHPSDRQGLKAELELHLAGGAAQLDHQHRVLHQDGTYRWIRVRAAAVRQKDGRARRIAGSATDVTETTVRDPLTGLANAVLLRDRLERLSHLASRSHDQAYAVLVVELDRLQEINAALGQAAGDALLMQFAQRLQSTVRRADMLARLGGAEFAVLLESATAEREATRVAQRIHQMMRLPFQLGQDEVTATASVGMVFSDPKPAEPNAVLRDARTASFRARSTGRGETAVFDPAAQERYAARLRIENDLRAALDHRLLSIVMQPIIALAEGKIRGAEVLARWQRPDRGWVSPTEFIPIAEETGLVTELDTWVLREACQQLRALSDKCPAARSLRLNVNVSTKQLHRGELAELVLSALAAAGLTTDRLRIEITETGIIEDLPASRDILRRLREVGVGVALDDFGTGFSSLSHLIRLPVDSLKIDRMFVSGADGHTFDELIVRSTITLAQALGMTVTAEGVETQDQLDRLKQLGCHSAQGFFLARPMPVDEFCRLLDSDPRW